MMSNESIESKMRLLIWMMAVAIGLAIAEVFVMMTVLGRI
jgi:hypothetical protein